ncbi:MAG: hypothetical protein CMJ58_26955 [Planctomycetaceae bacterium]|nr:hypothetical protein [Planctomycetaceae bacterium]
MSRSEIRHVLVVDDNPDDRAAVVRSLRADTANRYTFHEAESGAEALKLYAVASDALDLIVLDYRLNDMNAGEIVAQMLKDDEIPSVPIVLLTGTMGGEGRSELLALGVQDYFSKSAVTSELLPRIADNAIERHRLMWQLYESEQAAAAAQDEAERANRVKSQFLTSISHELRTPLTAILGFTELVRRDPTAADADRMLEMMATNGNHLAELLDDLIDIAKIEADRLEVVASPSRLRDVIQAACDLMAVRACENGLKLRCDIAPSVPEKAAIDPMRLRQILINLLSNAIKFTDAGEVRCNAICTDGDEVVIRVEDTGRGIATEKVARIFDPFVQGDDSADKRRTGVGLGLAISKRLAQMMGGDLTIESTSPQGTTFLLTIEAPCTEGEPANGQRTLGGPVGNAFRAAASEDSWAGKRVLLAEDTPANRFLLRKLLEPTGVELDCVEDGEQAVKRALVRLAEGDPYDLLLMDMQMPVMDGFEAVTQLVRLGHAAPIIAVTAAALSAERERCMAVGCSEVVTKPIDFDELQFVMNKYLG